ncbi:MAG TPA: TAXI family TRAP transporter solute-binding subunit [Syntrophorhabdales bacterium]|nr:TAXI family TRAP transporter solute-binding subunit [Syntrophorhabdales bacterium]
MKRSISIVTGVSIALLLVPFIVGSPAEAQLSKKYELSWGTIVAGGAWQIIGSAMLEDVKKANPNISGANVPSTPTATLMAIHQGKFNIGFSLTDATAEAWDGEGYFKSMGQVRNIRSLMTLYPQATHLVVRADSDIKRIEDFRGKRVSPAARGLSNDIEAQRLLKLYGMSYNDVRVQFLSFEDSAVQFIDGHLDVLLFLTVPFPFAPVINVNSHRQARLMSIPDDKVAQLTKFRGVEAYTLPNGMYNGIDYPVKGIAVRAHLVVGENMPDELAYAIVKAIAENFSRYPSVLKSMEYARPQDIGKDVGIPLHPGALKYYKERGLVK